MRAVIICLGDEVLTGSVVNSNAAYLAQKLTEMGIVVELHEVMSDYDPENYQRFVDLTKKYPLVICSGGLGPTIDDLTRPLLAKLAKSELVFDEALYQDLITRFKEHPSHRFQAMRPQGTEVLENRMGTACGHHLKINGCHLFALPGVPYEMKSMFEHALTPKLHQLFPQLKKGYQEVLHFFDLIEVEVNPTLEKMQKEYPGLDIGIYPSFGTLRVSIKGNSPEVVLPRIEVLKAKFGSHLFTSSTGKIEGALHDRLSKSRWRLATAESITGGHISSRIIAHSGASNYYEGGIIAYSNRLKESLLGVSRGLLEQKGAVSAEVAESMLKGLFIQTKADVGVAITGIAGPTGQTETKPIGLVYIAVGFAKGSIEIKKCQFTGDRALIIEKATTYAIGYLLQAISKVNNSC